MQIMKLATNWMKGLLLIRKCIILAPECQRLFEVPQQAQRLCKKSNFEIILTRIIKSSLILISAFYKYAMIFLKSVKYRTIRGKSNKFLMFGNYFCNSDLSKHSSYSYSSNFQSFSNNF